MKRDQNFSASSAYFSLDSTSHMLLMMIKEIEMWPEASPSMAWPAEVTERRKFRTSFETQNRYFAFLTPGPSNERVWESLSFASVENAVSSRNVS